MADASGSIHARLPIVLEKILRDRRVLAPHGGPLYSYRFTVDEIAALKAPLTQLLARAGITCLDTPWCSRAFVAIASNWVRTWRGEGVWGYAPLCAELGLNTDKITGIRSRLASAKACVAGAAGCAEARTAATNIWRR